MKKPAFIVLAPIVAVAMASIAGCSREQAPPVTSNPPASNNQPAVTSLPLSSPGETVSRDYPISNITTIRFTFPKVWRDYIQPPPPPDWQFTETILFERPGGAFSAKLVVIPAVPKVPQATLRRDLLKIAAETLPNSVETNADLVVVKTPESAGYYYSLTDKSLVGKPITPGVFKYQTQAMIKLGDHVVTVSAFYNDPDGPDYHAVLDLLNTAHVMDTNSSK